MARGNRIEKIAGKEINENRKNQEVKKAVSKALTVTKKETPGSYREGEIEWNEMEKIQFDAIKSLQAGFENMDKRHRELLEAETPLDNDYFGLLRDMAFQIKILGEQIKNASKMFFDPKDQKTDNKIEILIRRQK